MLTRKKYCGGLVTLNPIWKNIMKNSWRLIMNKLLIQNRLALIHDYLTQMERLSKKDKEL